MGNSGFRGVPSTLNHNVTNMVNLNTLLEREKKPLQHNLMQQVHMMGWWVENVLHEHLFKV